MDFREFLKASNENCFHFLKWVQIIQQEDKAEKLDAMYILEKDQDYCEVIFVDKNGAKRKVGGVSSDVIREDFALLDLSNLSEENKSQWKIELGGLSAYELAKEVGFEGDFDNWMASLKGEKGDAPEHQWSNTSLRFKNPDGTFGQYVNLKGAKGDPGSKGDVGDISILTFEVNDDMNLMMQLQTNSTLNFEIDENGHLILNN